MSLENSTHQSPRQDEPTISSSMERKKTGCVFPPVYEWHFKGKKYSIKWLCLREAQIRCFEGKNGTSLLCSSRLSYLNNLFQNSLPKSPPPRLQPLNVSVSSTAKAENNNGTTTGIKCLNCLDCTNKGVVPLPQCFAPEITTETVIAILKSRSVCVCVCVLRHSISAISVFHLSLTSHLALQDNIRQQRKAVCGLWHVWTS